MTIDHPRRSFIHDPRRQEEAAVGLQAPSTEGAMAADGGSVAVGLRPPPSSGVATTTGGTGYAATGLQEDPSTRGAVSAGGCSTAAGLQIPSTGVAVTTGTSYYGDTGTSSGVSSSSPGLSGDMDSAEVGRCRCSATVPYFGDRQVPQQSNFVGACPTRGGRVGSLCRERLMWATNCCE